MQPYQSHEGEVLIWLKSTQRLYINTLKYTELLDGLILERAYESQTLSSLLWTLDSITNGDSVYFTTIQYKILEGENFGKTFHTKYWQTTFWRIPKIAKAPKLILRFLPVNLNRRALLWCMVKTFTIHKYIRISLASQVSHFDLA